MRINEIIEFNNDNTVSVISDIDKIRKNKDNLIIVISTGLYANLMLRSDVKFFDKVYDKNNNTNIFDFICIGEKNGMRIYVNPLLSFMDNNIRIIEI